MQYRRVGRLWGKKRSELDGAGRSGGKHGDAGRYAGMHAEEGYRELEAEQYQGAELENRPRAVEVGGRPRMELEAEQYQGAELENRPRAVEVGGRPLMERL